ncbi:hypothetical protein EGW08_006361 [Elysia chlorotica]|uniref:Uncharacterized protein n=1 Tax=Elysia chlorotica TaxID=188477 RepID=A0A3S0ZY15_ELYCH|nr:hypothetical protein EGW08_006361 [Elysia chlorotica]
MVTFLDPKNRFSILVFSCENPRILTDISSEFKKLKNRRVLESTASSPKVNGSVAVVSGNSKARQLDSVTVATVTNSEKPKTNGISQEIKAPSVQIQTQKTTQNGRGGVYNTTIDIQKETVQKPQLNGVGVLEQVVPLKSMNGGLIDNGDTQCEVYREVASRGSDFTVQTYNVGLQANPTETNSENESASASGSIRSVSWSHDVEDSVFESNGEQTSSISAEEYHNVRNRTTLTNNNGQEKDKNAQMANGNGPNRTIISIGQLRNVGTQTESLQRVRYTKRPLKPSLSNQYKEKVQAARKKSGNTHVATPTSTNSGPSATVNIAGRGETLRASPGKTSLVVEVAPVAPQSMNHMNHQPTVSTSRSTVSRPIESVYSRRHPSLTYGHDPGAAVELDPHRRGPKAGPKRVVVLPNRQAVVLYPVSPGPKSGYLREQQFVQNPFFGAGMRLRKTSTNSNHSFTAGTRAEGGGSRSNSLRMRAGEPGHAQTSPRPVSYTPPTI